MLYTNHARARMSQRGISPRHIEQAIECSQPLHRAGVIFCFVRDKDTDTEQIRGLTIVLNRDATTVLTVYKKRRKGLRAIKKKHKRTG